MEYFMSNITGRICVLAVTQEGSLKQSNPYIYFSYSPRMKSVIDVQHSDSGAGRTFYPDLNLLSNMCLNFNATIGEKDYLVDFRPNEDVFDFKRNLNTEGDNCHYARPIVLEGETSPKGILYLSFTDTTKDGFNLPSPVLEVANSVLERFIPHLNTTYQGNIVSDADRQKFMDVCNSSSFDRSNIQVHFN